MIVPSRDDTDHRLDERDSLAVEMGNRRGCSRDINTPINLLLQNQICFKIMTTATRINTKGMSDQAYHLT